MGPDYYNYRITVGDSTTYHTDYPGDLWSHNFEAIAERGYTAKFERQFVCGLGMLGFFPDELPKGWIRLPDRIICDWQTIAEIGPERRCVIVG